MPERQKRYRRTKKGLLSRIYHDQKRNSKNRDIVGPDYTLKEFRKKYEKDPVFINRYEIWVQHDYLQSLRPSFDRIDCFKGYTFDNLQIVTCRTNFCKAVEDKKLHQERKKKRKIKYYEEKFCSECEKDMIQKIEVFESFIIYTCTICQKVEKKS
jgi:hypothetical protein